MFERIKNRIKKEEIKSHFKKHQTAYACAATAVVVAGITAIMMRSSAARGGTRVEGARGGPVNTASLTFSNKQTINVTTVLDREGRGHPGWPVRNLETKRIFFSQREAALAFDIPEGVLSGHINGRFPDVDGLHFERVNLAEAA